VGGQGNALAAYLRETDPVPIVQGAQWVPGPVRKIPLPPGIDPPTVQPVTSRYINYATPAHTPPPVLLYFEFYHIRLHHLQLVSTPTDIRFWQKF
jgi:hypothetical protein